MIFVVSEPTEQHSGALSIDGQQVLSTDYSFNYFVDELVTLVHVSLCLGHGGSSAFEFYSNSGIVSSGALWTSSHASARQSPDS